MAALGFLLRVSDLQVRRSWRLALLAVLLLVTASARATATGIVDGPRLVPTLGCNNKLPSLHRKLLLHLPGKERGRKRRGQGQGQEEGCKIGDIMISQGASAPLSDGIPSYRVEIANECASGCDIHSIHVTCGWFSSARLVNPNIFKRLGYNDCLVNAGKPLKSGTTLSFQYANTFLYPLSVSSVSCSSSIMRK